MRYKTTYVEIMLNSEEHNAEAIVANQMHETVQQKIKLQQKKARLIIEEVKFKIKERKMRTRHLIEMGGLIAKAELDNLPTNSLLGALLSLKQELVKTPNIQEQWTKVGRDLLDHENDSRTAVILKFETKPEESIRTHIRQHGLKWNALRSEWYGYASNIPDLKSGLGDTQYQIEIVE